MKERLGLTEIRKQANRMSFGEVRPPPPLITTPPFCFVNEGALIKAPPSDRGGRVPGGPGLQPGPSGQGGQRPRAADADQRGQQGAHLQDAAGAPHSAPIAAPQRHNNHCPTAPQSLPHSAPIAAPQRPNRCPTAPQSLPHSATTITAPQRPNHCPTAPQLLPHSTPIAPP